MARGRRAPQEFIKDITVEPDGLRTREAHDWTRIKLGILTSYLRAYARACRSAGRFYLVDAMSGPGRCHILETGEHLLGSSLIALTTEPKFERVLSIEYMEANVEALRRRTTAFGDRSAVERGDCNRDLWAFMGRHIPRRAPSFVLLDPEGAELEWQSVRSVSAFREGELKSEMLILFATEGVNRMLPVEGEIDERNAMRLDQLFPPDFNWRETWDRRRGDEITPAQARLEYVQGYMEGLRRLGYRSVLHREVARTNGRLVYHLVFATDHPAGETIMTDVFGNMNPNEPQLPLI